MSCYVKALRMLPDFCWQTFDETLSYVEQIDDGIEYHILSVALHHATRRGEIETKLARRTRRSRGALKIRMYKRKADVSGMVG